MPKILICGEERHISKELKDELIKAMRSQGETVTIEDSSLMSGQVVLTNGKSLIDIYEEQFIKPKKSKNKGRNRGKFGRMR